MSDMEQDCAVQNRNELENLDWASGFTRAILHSSGDASSKL